MSEKHTPGPWIFSGTRYVYGPRQVTICQLDDVGSTAPESDQYGNGLLLSAAPEGYELAKLVVELRLLIHEDSPTGKLARQIIAKVEGTK